MPEPDPWHAARDRDRGMLRIRQITWRASLAAAASAAVLAAALAQHPASSAAAVRHQGESGSIVIPAQPPQPSGGSGQVTSGAS